MGDRAPGLGANQAELIPSGARAQALAAEDGWLACTLWHPGRTREMRTTDGKDVSVQPAPFVIAPAAIAGETVGLLIDSGTTLPLVLPRRVAEAAPWKDAIQPVGNAAVHGSGASAGALEVRLTKTFTFAGSDFNGLKALVVDDSAVPADTKLHAIVGMPVLRALKCIELDFNAGRFRAGH